MMPSEVRDIRTLVRWLAKTYHRGAFNPMAARLGVSECDVRNRLHRARALYKEAILDVIRAYTDSEAEAAEELRDLLGAFS